VIQCKAAIRAGWSNALIRIDDRIAQIPIVRNWMLLKAVRLHRAALVVSKVDRLTRSVAFLSKLLEANVDVRFADLPQIEGPTGQFMLQQMASVAYQ
jgi:hypothetical protein